MATKDESHNISDDSFVLNAETKEQFPPSPLSSKTPKITPKQKFFPLEPAFRGSFPPGWMVYHPELGVIPKTEADRLEEEQKTRFGISCERSETRKID